MVERTNRTIKVTLTRWVQETGTSLDGLIAISVKEDQNDHPPHTPPSRLHGYSPYEIMFKRPPLFIWEVKGNSLQRGGMEVLQ